MALWSAEDQRIAHVYFESWGGEKCVGDAHCLACRQGAQMVNNVRQGLVAEATAVINECREDGETDLRSVRSRIQGLVR